jgi:hypothetical protein
MNKSDNPNIVPPRKFYVIGDLNGKPRANSPSIDQTFLVAYLNEEFGGNTNIDISPNEKNLSNYLNGLTPLGEKNFEAGLTGITGIVITMHPGAMEVIKKLTCRSSAPGLTSNYRELIRAVNSHYTMGLLSVAEYDKELARVPDELFIDFFGIPTYRVLDLFKGLEHNMGMKMGTSSTIVPQYDQFMPVIAKDYTLWLKQVHELQMEKDKLLKSVLS